MSERYESHAADSSEPLTSFARFLDEATTAGIDEPNAMVLSTSGGEGRVSSRVVLLKGFDERGFVFFTNLVSRKARAIEENPQVALNFFWREIDKQVLIEGTARAVGDEDADEYFASRSRASRLGAWGSRQSAPVGSREELLRAVDEHAARFEGREVPRPPFWSGYRVKHDYLELWTRGEHRLHERIAYSREGGGWTKRLLQP